MSGPHDIDLWVFEFDKAIDGSLQTTYRALLNEAELEREKRFSRPEDSHRYLLTRALVRSVLSKYCSVDPRAWEFKTNRYGRPELANLDSHSAPLSFNVSHTMDLILLGVAINRPLGVDVEGLQHRRKSLTRIAERWFSPRERADLHSTAESVQLERFFEYWTLKESYIKARGMGFAIPIRKVEFELDGENSVRLLPHPDLVNTELRWSFWQLRLTPNHIAAICAHREDSERLNLRVTRITPLIHEETIAPRTIRSSQQCGARTAPTRLSFSTTNIGTPLQWR